MVQSGILSKAKLWSTALLALLSITIPLANCDSALAKAKSKIQPQNALDPVQSQNSAADGLFAERVPSDGIMRDFYIHLPPQVMQTIASGNPPPSLPMVMVFHGGLGLAARMDQMTGFNSIADREGFIVVYPQGIDRHWYDGRNVEGQNRFDDVDFVKNIIDHMERKYRADSQHIYACGISNGGFFAQYVALQLPTKIAAVASVAATLPALIASGRPSLKPMSVLYILGLNDPLVPFKGGPIHYKHFKDRGMLISASQAAVFWQTGNRGSKMPTSVDLPDTDPTDNCRVKVATFGGGLRGSEVVVYGIEGGGHTWPGSIPTLSKGLVGETCRDISASEVIWDFFKRH